MFSKAAIYLYITIVVGVFAMMGKNVFVCNKFEGAKAVNACTSTIKYLPLDSIKISSLKKRAENHERMDNPEGAYNDYADVVKLDGEMSVKKLTDVDILEVYEKAASLAFMLKKHDEAYKYSDLAIKAGTEKSKIYEIRGEENIVKTAYYRAIDDFEKSLSLGAQNPLHIRFNLARAYTGINKFKSASNNFKKVEVKMKNDFDFNMAMGYFHFKQKKYRSSLHYYKGALRLDPLSSVCQKSIKKTELKLRERFN